MPTLSPVTANIRFSFVFYVAKFKVILESTVNVIKEASIYNMKQASKSQVTTGYRSSSKSSAGSRKYCHTESFGSNPRRAPICFWNYVCMKGCIIGSFIHRRALVVGPGINIYEHHSATCWWTSNNRIRAPRRKPKMQSGY